jgi:hypothetical protein
MAAHSAIAPRFTSCTRIGILWELIGMPGPRWIIGLAVLGAACRFDLPAVPAGPATSADAATNGTVDTPVPPDAPKVWWNTVWTHRRPITIQNTALPGPVQKFPLLVRLPAGIMPNELRFLAADHSTILPHEIDTVDASGILAWVRIPDIQNTGAAPVIWAYYGNPAATTSTSNGAMVFGDTFVSVHHLGQSYSVDSSGNNHPADSTGNERGTQTTGIIGPARNFDGSNDHLDVTGEAAYDFTTAFSASIWIRRQALGTVPYMAIITKGDTAWRLNRDNLNPFAGFGTTEGGTPQNLAGTVSIDDGNWHHLAIVLGIGKKRLYVDGQLDTVASAGAVDTNNFAVSFGENIESTVGGQRFWNGNLDEARISADPHDAAWIFAEYHNATDPGFTQFGPDEPYMP